MVAFDEAEPCQCVADERGFFLAFYMGRLVVDGVEAAQDGVVDVAHVRCAGGEDVGFVG